MHFSFIAILAGAVIAGVIFALGSWILAVAGKGDPPFIKPPFDRVAYLALLAACIVIFICYAIGRFAVPTFGL